MRQAEQFAQLATKALSGYNGASLEAAALKYCQSLGFAGFKFCLLWSEGAQRFSLNLAAQGGMTASIGFGRHRTWRGGQDRFRDLRAGRAVLLAFGARRRRRRVERFRRVPVTRGRPFRRVGAGSSAIRRAYRFALRLWRERRHCNLRKSGEQRTNRSAVAGSIFIPTSANNQQLRFAGLAFEQRAHRFRASRHRDEAARNRRETRQIREDDPKPNRFRQRAPRRENDDGSGYPLEKPLDEAQKGRLHNKAEGLGPGLTCGLRAWVRAILRISDVERLVG